MSRSTIELERPRGVRQHSTRGLTQQIGTSDWRATVNGTRKCSIDGCEQPHKGRGFCGSHYSEWRRATPREAQGWPTRSERFWRKVDRTGGPDACWPFTGSVNDHGYGIFYTPGGSRAHRYAFMLENGAPAAGDVDHTCHNGSGCTKVDDCPHRRCCNPRHLDDVSHAENVRRGNAHVSRVIYGPAVQTHCKWGHEFTEENTWRNRHGHRFCRACARANQARTRARKRNEGDA